jgi:hypothetical protein
MLTHMSSRTESIISISDSGKSQLSDEDNIMINHGGYEDENDTAERGAILPIKVKRESKRATV